MIHDDSPLTFREFYASTFLDEHRHPANVALHVFGVLAGLALIPVSLSSALPWLVLAWPIVHTAPGLVGHRLFESNPVAGNLRVTRRDFSPLWFLAANHRMALELVLGRLAWDRRDI